uniref:Carboxymethylenebutenolidase homolog n=1 Tax=Rattus norvegicus TaxID=10116 RepID=A0ABK0L0W7_RAT
MVSLALPESVGGRLGQKEAVVLPSSFLKVFFPSSQTNNPRHMKRICKSVCVWRVGERTIVPDFFVGQEPWDPAGDWSTFPEWLKSRNARKINREVDAVLRYLKQQCHAQKIGIVGFCWGGIVVHHVMTTYPEVRAGVSVYGIIRDSEDVYNLKNPTLFIFAENDAVIPLEQVSILIQKLKEHCIVNYQVKTFSGQTHGFVHRKREDCSPADKPYIEEARRNLIEWLNKYI